MKRLAWLLALAPAVALAAYAYLPFKMVSTARAPLPYYVDGRQPQPGGVALSSVQLAADTAWSIWNGVQCASPKVVGRGLTTGSVPNPSDTFDQYNVTPVFVVSRADPDYYDVIGSPYVAAITIPRAYAGVLQTCDIFFNGADYTWSVQAVTAATDLDLQTTMMHEAGHCLGLDHQILPGDLMQYSITPGVQIRTLSADDVQALCQQNPAAGAPAAPCLADGGCGTAALKCLSQVGSTGTMNLCSAGCALAMGSSCPAPQSCQASGAFSPAYDGACLLPGFSTTTVGKQCSVDGDCGGSPYATCTQPVASPSGHLFWSSGYCTQSCAPGRPACPAGSLCTQLGTSQLCLAQCRVGLADCRGEYSCVDGSGGGVCMPSCYTDNDCADPVNYTCRACDGLCVSRQNPAGLVGDICTADSACGAGQVCTQLVTRAGTRQCALSCGRGCGLCPTGSTCHPMAHGELYCLRDCAGPGSCPPGLMCTQFPTGMGCTPACHLDTDCPVGQTCELGECALPINPDDAGCNVLCNPTDGGKPVVIPPRDGGGGGGGTGGCGCQSVSAPFALLLLALWATALRRARWR